MIKNNKLIDNGFIEVDFQLDDVVLSYICNENWRGLDDYFINISKPGQQLHSFLLNFLEFDKLEHIIAIRSAPTDEDGIWHDDGSRFLGFSLSLNLDPANIMGGQLKFKQKSSQDMTIFPPQPFGRMVLFLSGLYGYEHMVSAVVKNRRIVIAGWCS